MMICRKHKTCPAAVKINCPHRGQHQDTSYCGEPRKHGNGCAYDEEAYCILIEDLELITEGDDMPKYKWTDGKQQSIVSLYTNGDHACEEFHRQLGSLANHFRPLHLGDIIPLDILIAWADQDTKHKRIKWLIEKGYIEKVESEYDKWAEEAYHISAKPTCEIVEWAKRMPRE